MQKPHKMKEPAKMKEPTKTHQHAVHTTKTTVVKTGHHPRPLTPTLSPAYAPNSSTYSPIKRCRTTSTTRPNKRRQRKTKSASPTTPKRKNTKKNRNITYLFLFFFIYISLFTFVSLMDSINPNLCMNSPSLKTQ